MAGRSLAAELGGAAAVIGRDLVLPGRSCRVSGVVKGAGSALGFDFERLVIAPIGLVRAMDSDGSRSDLELHAGFAGQDDIDAIGRRLTAELRKHRHSARGEDDFIVVTAQRLRSYLDTTLASVRAGLFLLMAVVFAVAALGIGNVMLSGVNARRREIAIKRAIGASRGGIFLEFLAEAVILTGFGGVLGVVEHRAKTDVPADDKSGYVGTAQVIALAEAAGFKLDGKSEINANPRDTKDYPNGVWTLPRVNKHEAADYAKYLAIGESDRMTLRFRKPR
ncbi:FtsX-like permease family protein [Lysobacter sp. 2RAB21]